MFAKITLDTTDFGEGIKGISKEMLQAKKNIENVGTSVKNAAKTFATIGASIGAAGTAVFAFANKISQTGDNIDKMSQKLGMSAEKYQEWSHILEHSGASIDSLQSSMKTLASAAETGNDAFEKLGLTQDKIAGLSQEDLFETTITALQNVTSETERTYLAGQLLGRGATELGPLLNTSAEDIEAMRQNLHDMGAVMSDEAVKNSAAFQDALTNLKSAFSGAANGLAAELIPKLTELMGRVTDFVASGGLESIIDGFQTMAPVITAAATAMMAFKAANAVAGVINAVTTAVGSQTLSFKALFAVLNTSPFALIATLIAAVGTALVTLYMTNEDFRNKVNAAWKSVKDTVSGVVSSLVIFFTETVPNAGREMLEFFKSIPSMALQWGKDLIQNFIDGIKEKIAALKEMVSNVAQTVKDFLGFSEPKEGPLSNFHTYAPDMMKLFSQGITENAWLVKSAFNNGLDFGTASVDFASSGLGMSSAGIINNMNTGRSYGTNIPSRIELVMKSEDGQTFGRWMVPFIRSEDKSNPEVVSDAV